MALRHFTKVCRFSQPACPACSRSFIEIDIQFQMHTECRRCQHRPCGQDSRYEGTLPPPPSPSLSFKAAQVYGTRNRTQNPGANGTQLLLCKIWVAGFPVTRSNPSQHKSRMLSYIFTFCPSLRCGRPSALPTSFPSLVFDSQTHKSRINPRCSKYFSPPLPLPTSSPLHPGAPDLPAIHARRGGVPQPPPPGRGPGSRPPQHAG